MITFLTRLAAKRLAKRSTEAKRERILSKARQLRRECGLPPSKVLAG